MIYRGGLLCAVTASRDVLRHWDFVRYSIYVPQLHTRLHLVVGSNNDDSLYKQDFLETLYEELREENNDTILIFSHAL